jgi:general secretion pathway protein J
MKRPPSGFTLLELVVALAIFALISIFAYRALDLVLDTRAKVTAEGKKWRNIALLFARLEQDLGRLVNRPVRDSHDLLSPALLGEPVPVGEDDAQLMFTRMGLEGQSGVLNDAQRLGYRLRDGNVEMLVWPVLDQAPRTRPEVDTVLSGVKAMEIRYLGADGTWLPRWPKPGAPGELPRALEITLELTTGERMTRLFAL